MSCCTQSGWLSVRCLFCGSARAGVELDETSTTPLDTLTASPGAPPPATLYCDPGATHLLSPHPGPTMRIENDIKLDCTFVARALARSRAVVIRRERLAPDSPPHVLPPPTVKDVLIRPKRSKLKSRSQVSLERTFTFKHSGTSWTGVPIIAANMDTTGTFELAVALAEHGAIVALHKHYTWVLLGLGRGRAEREELGLPLATTR